MADHARELRREFSPSKLNETLDEAVRERPMLDHVLDLGIVGRAVAIGAVGALILWILVGPGAAAIALVLLFLGSWYVLAQLSFDRRRRTRPFGASDDAEDADGQAGADAA
jgi:Flp pilus assembly protein TadB